MAATPASGGHRSGRHRQHVTVVEFADTLRADDVLQKKARSMGNIDIIMSARTSDRRRRVVGMDYDRTTGGSSIWRWPASSSDRPGAEHRVPQRKRDCPDPLWRNRDRHQGCHLLPGVYAAGDATTVPFKQIIISIGGRCHRRPGCV